MGSTATRTFPFAPKGMQRQSLRAIVQVPAAPSAQRSKQIKRARRGHRPTTLVRGRTRPYQIRGTPGVAPIGASDLGGTNQTLNKHPPNDSVQLLGSAGSRGWHCRSRETIGVEGRTRQLRARGWRQLPQRVELSAGPLAIPVANSADRGAHTASVNYYMKPFSANNP